MMEPVTKAKIPGSDKMDKKSIKELEILHELSKSEGVNQRYLSKKLGMASGLVNLYIKRLAQKGYIKISGVNPRRLKYLLTPTGIAEKTRLTYEFASLSYKYIKTATNDINAKLGEIERRGARNVVVLGTGELAELCLLLIQNYDMRVVAVVDDGNENNRFFGVPIISRDLLGNLWFDAMIVAKMGPDEETTSIINEFGIKPENVCSLLEAPSAQ